MCYPQDLDAELAAKIATTIKELEAANTVDLGYVPISNMKSFTVIPKELELLFVVPHCCSVLLLDSANFLNDV